MFCPIFSYHVIIHRKHQLSFNIQEVIYTSTVITILVCQLVNLIDTLLVWKTCILCCPSRRTIIFLNEGSIIEMHASTESLARNHFCIYINANVCFQILESFGKGYLKWNITEYLETKSASTWSFYLDQPDICQMSAYMCKLLSFHLEPPKAHFTLCSTKEAH